MRPQVTARGLLETMKKHGCTVLSHGATGAVADGLRMVDDGLWMADGWLNDGLSIDHDGL